MRVDQQQRVAVLRQLRRDRDAVGAGRLARDHAQLLGRRRGGLAVEGLEVAQRDTLDIAADAAFGEAECHPRFEAGQHLRLARMNREVEVEAICPRIHQLAQPGGAAGILRLQFGIVDEQPLAQIGVDRILDIRFARSFRGAAEGGEIIRLDPRKIILGLRIDQPEHRIGIGASLDVRNAPVIAGDRHARGFGLPPRHIGIGRRGGGQQGDRDQQGGEHLHGASVTALSAHSHRFCFGRARLSVSGASNTQRAGERRSALPIRADAAIPRCCL